MKDEKVLISLTPAGGGCNLAEGQAGGGLGRGAAAPKTAALRASPVPGPGLPPPPAGGTPSDLSRLAAPLSRQRHCCDGKLRLIWAPGGAGCHGLPLAGWALCRGAGRVTVGARRGEQPVDAAG